MCMYDTCVPLYFGILNFIASKTKFGEGNGTHSSTLAWKILWTEEPGRLQSMGSLRVGHNWMTSLSLFTFMHWRRKWQPTPVFLPGESQGRGSLVGCRLWGLTESDMTESDLAAAAARQNSLLVSIIALCINIFSFFFLSFSFPPLPPFSLSLSFFFCSFIFILSPSLLFFFPLSFFPFLSYPCPCLLFLFTLLWSL